MRAGGLPFRAAPADALPPLALTMLTALLVPMAAAPSTRAAAGDLLLLVPGGAPGTTHFLTERIRHETGAEVGDPWPHPAVRHLLERATGAPLPDDAPLPTIVEVPARAGVAPATLRRAVRRLDGAITLVPADPAADRGSPAVALAGGALLAGLIGAGEARRLLAQRADALALLARLGATSAQAALLTGSRAALGAAAGAAGGGALGWSLALLTRGDPPWAAALVAIAVVAAAALLGGFVTLWIGWRRLAR